MTTIIECPRCRRRGALSGPDGGLSNDNEDRIALAAPDGFRKIQPGWRSTAILFYCVDCSVPAIRVNS